MACQLKLCLVEKQTLVDKTSNCLASHLPCKCTSSMDALYEPYEHCSLCSCSPPPASDLSTAFVNAIGHANWMAGATFALLNEKCVLVAYREQRRVSRACLPALYRHAHTHTYSTQTLADSIVNCCHVTSVVAVGDTRC